MSIVYGVCVAVCLCGSVFMCTCVVCVNVFPHVWCVVFVWCVCMVVPANVSQAVNDRSQLQCTFQVNIPFKVGIYDPSTIEGMYGGVVSKHHRTQYRVTPLLPITPQCLSSAAHSRRTSKVMLCYSCMPDVFKILF